MSRLVIATTLILLFLFSNTLQAQPKLSLRTGVIGEGQPWAVTWYEVASINAGPTVLVTGGVHGNEPAGWRAAEQIRQWPISRGKLIVIPTVNRAGIRANMRWLPQFRNDRSDRDANRNFPRDRQANSIRTPLCLAVWEFVEGCGPDWFFDLHEGFDFHHKNPKSVGSSVITNNSDVTHEIASHMITAVNCNIKNSEHIFDLLGKTGPADGSLARACWQHLGARAFILETTFKNQPISLRTRQHRNMMSTALQAIGVLDRDQSHQISPQSRNFIRIGLFDGLGTGPSSESVARAIEVQTSMKLFHLGPADIKPEVLSQIDVLVFPGGSGSRQGNALGKERRECVQAFIENGGGVVGICAGAYLCSSHYSWSLDLLNTKVFNETRDVPGIGKKSMWYRGAPSDVLVEMTDEGNQLFRLNGVHKVRYQNGPIVSPGTNHGLDDYLVLAYFRSEVSHYEAQIGTMIHTPAIVSGRRGKGRVLSISPHFESTDGLEHVVARAVEWVCPERKD